MWLDFLFQPIDNNLKLVSIIQINMQEDSKLIQSNQELPTVTSPCSSFE